MGISLPVSRCRENWHRHTHSLHACDRNARIRKLRESRADTGS